MIGDVFLRITKRASDDVERWSRQGSPSVLHGHFLQGQINRAYPVRWQFRFLPRIPLIDANETVELELRS